MFHLTFASHGIATRVSWRIRGGLWGLQPPPPPPPPPPRRLSQAHILTYAFQG